MPYIHHFDSPLGGITAASDGHSLTGLWFDGQKHFAAVLEPPCRECHLPIFDQTGRWLDVYFSGCVPDFTPPVSIRTTAFRSAVLQLLFAIPYGKTTTYGNLAGMIAKQRGLARMSAQAVGNAVGHNPICLIIPCHRVISADGSLTGYAAGIDRKAKLLLLERADLSSHAAPGNGIR